MSDKKEFQAAVSADPAFTEAYIHLADVYLQKGQTPKAKQALQSAIDKAKSPDDPWAKPYQYANPGVKGPIDVYSLGADGVVGGDGLNADIGSWQ